MDAELRRWCQPKSIAPVALPAKQAALVTREPSCLRSASIARPSDIVSNATPTGSSGRPSGSLVSATSGGTARARATQKGMLARKIQRHPNHAARRLPSVGPRAMATPEITPMTPNARDRCPAPGNALATSASAPVTRNAAPAPCRTRAAKSVSPFVAMPHPIEASRNTALPPNMLRRRPKRSASAPAARSAPVNARL